MAESAARPTSTVETLPEASGQIRAINQQKRTVVLKEVGKEQTFDVVADAVVVKNGNTNGGLRDLVVGDEVTVSYRVDGEKLIAQRIKVDEPKAAGMSDSLIPPVDSDRLLSA